jgi:hypothetical protein
VEGFPPELIAVIVGALVMTALLIVSIAKTVRFHGWGKQNWAPPAVPWFIAAMAVGMLSLGYGLLWGVGIL